MPRTDCPKTTESLWFLKMGYWLASRSQKRIALPVLRGRTRGVLRLTRRRAQQPLRALRLSCLVLLGGVLVVATACTNQARHTNATPERYDDAVVAMHPALYLHVAGVTPNETNLADGSEVAVWRLSGPVHRRKLPNGTNVVDFHPGDVLTVHSAPTLSIPTTGMLTVVSWIRPDTLQFSQETGSGYVYWMGKGANGTQEWALRMYSKLNSEDPPRPNRISGYVFDLEGGKGSGAYVQDPVTVGRWIMVGFEVDAIPSPGYPQGWVAIWVDGTLRDRASLGQFDVVPRAGPAPLRIGTEDLESYFEGAIGDVAIFNRDLSTHAQEDLYRAMTEDGAAQES